MRRLVQLACLSGLGLLPVIVPAQDFTLHAYIDARLVAAPDETSWTNGGLGKTRFGGGDTTVKFGGAAVAGIAQLTPALLAFADLQFQTTDRPTMDVIEAYLRYRPVSTSRWRWSVQAGTFVPPVSLENDAIGWTSPWTLTPSAINSWVGEEIRATGGEARLEWRGDVSTYELRTALFQRNDPAGKLLAVRGWSLSDLTYGLGSRLRQPDATYDQPANRYDPFQKIGNRYGWYADLSWHATGLGKLSLMHFDNRADPAAHTGDGDGNGVFAWHTRFWSLGGSTDTGPITWIAQAMDGSTIIEPVDGLQFKTRFRSAFLLAGWNRGRWRPTLRVEHFSTDDLPSTPGVIQGEHGNAVTAALNWRPRSWLRFTAEVLRINSVRTERVDLGLAPASDITQVQLGVRLIY